MPYICTKFHEEISVKADTKYCRLNFDRKCDLDPHWTGLIYEFCTSFWYGEHLRKASNYPSIGEGDMGRNEKSTDRQTG